MCMAQLAVEFESSTQSGVVDHFHCQATSTSRYSMLRDRRTHPGTPHAGRPAQRCPHRQRRERPHSPSLHPPAFCASAHVWWHRRAPQLLCSNYRKCLSHEQTERCCGIDLRECDFYIAGFPCKPFSGYNMQNFVRSPQAKMLDPEAVPFLEISKMLDGPNCPKCVILENVTAITAVDKATGMAPIDFIMGGRKGSNRYGLRLKEQYVLETFILQADSFALPHKRSRIYIVMLRVDIASGDAFEHIKEVIERHTELGQSRVGHVRDFLIVDPAGCQRLQDAGFGGRVTRTVREGTIEGFNKLRRKLGLPLRGQPNASPYSKLLGDHPGKASLGLRRLELVDLVLLKERGSSRSPFPDAIPPHLIVNTSQRFERHCWKHSGRVDTPTTSAELWHVQERRYINAPEVFQMMGWPREELKLEEVDGMASGWRNLTGNMMALPCIGVSMLAVLATTMLHPDSDFRAHGFRPTARRD